MSAKEHLPNVVAYLQGELGPVETVRFERALAESPDLQAEVAAARRTLGRLDELLPDADVPPPVRAAVFARVATEPQEPRVRPSLQELAREVGPRRRRRMLVLALAAAASVVLAVVLAWQPAEPPRQPRVQLASVHWSHGTVMVNDLTSSETGHVAPPWRVSRETSTSEPPELFGSQRIITLADSFAECEIGSRARVLLDQQTTLSILDARTPDAADWLWLERGLAHFDVAPAAGSPPSAGAVRGAPAAVRPFVLFTRHGEVRVRGTRFLVQVAHDVTVVVVLQGRVDAFAVPRHGDARPMVAVTAGHFAALGTPAALHAALPPGDDLPPLEPGEDGGWAGHDPSLPVAISRPMLAVEFRVDQARVNVDDPAPTWGRVTLRNGSPFTIRLRHAGDDNLMLHHRGTATDVSPWTPWRQLRLTLKAGEPYRDGLSLPTVLYEYGEGPYYVSAVYTGVLEVGGPSDALLAQHNLPAAPSGEPYNRSAVFESRSVPVSIVYRRDGDANGEDSNENEPNHGKDDEPEEQE